MKYSFTKGIGKALISLAIVGIPILLQVLPTDLLNLTVSGILLIALNWAKFTINNA